MGHHNITPNWTLETKCNWPSHVDLIQLWLQCNRTKIFQAQWWWPESKLKLALPNWILETTCSWSHPICWLLMQLSVFDTFWGHCASRRNCYHSGETLKDITDLEVRMTFTFNTKTLQMIVLDDKSFYILTIEQFRSIGYWYWNSRQREKTCVWSESQARQRKCGR